MAIVDKITGENIERFRGIIDFYMLRGRLPVARKWPKKPKPPYTALQAEAMAVFAIANSCLSRISANMLEEWRKGTTGVRPQWTDIFRGIIMHHWKLFRVIAPIALDYHITETLTTYKVTWDILQVYIDPLIPEELYTWVTPLINKVDLENVVGPQYFTLFDDLGNRLVAPYILSGITPLNKEVDMDIIVRNIADVSNSTTTFADITGLSFSMLANADYIIEAWLIFRSNTLTTGIKFALNGPASPVAVVLNAHIPIALTLYANSNMLASRAYNTGTSSVSVDTINSNLLCRLEGLVRNGVNAGILAIRFAAETTGTVKIMAGSILKYRQVD